MKSNFYHLSHIDLDGYGCHYLTKKAFDNVKCYNANYGAEVSARLDEIVDSIKKDSPTDAHILITDLNLTPKEASKIQKDADDIGAKLTLLDHHITGKNCSERFAWYHLDSSKCATKLTYEWLQENYNFDSQNSSKELVETINDVDMWHSQNSHFEFGKVMMSLIASAKEINRIMFQNEDSSYKSFLIENSQQFLSQQDGYITLDDNMHSIKKEFFMQSKNDTKDNLVASYVSHLLSSQKERFSIEYNGYKGLLGYNIGNSSIIGNRFLVENPDFHFYMDINFRGIFSLRGNDTIDLSQMATIVGNGGGHKNASGGKLDDFRESFVYEDIKAFVQKSINDKLFLSR